MVATLLRLTTPILAVEPGEIFLIIVSVSIRSGGTGLTRRVVGNYRRVLMRRIRIVLFLGGSMLVPRRLLGTGGRSAQHIELPELRGIAKDFQRRLFHLREVLQPVGVGEFLVGDPDSCLVHADRDAHDIVARDKRLGVPGKSMRMIDDVKNRDLFGFAFGDRKTKLHSHSLFIDEHGRTPAAGRLVGQLTPLFIADQDDVGVVTTLDLPFFAYLEPHHAADISQVAHEERLGKAVMLLVIIREGGGGEIYHDVLAAVESFRNLEFWFLGKPAEQLFSAGRRIFFEEDADLRYAVHYARRIPRTLLMVSGTAEITLIRVTIIVHDTLLLFVK